MMAKYGDIASASNLRSNVKDGYFNLIKYKLLAKSDKVERM